MRALGLAAALLALGACAPEDPDDHPPVAAPPPPVESPPVAAPPPRSTERAIAAEHAAVDAQELAVSADGTVYLSETQRIYALADGVVRLVAGGLRQGTRDGAGDEARLWVAAALAAHGDDLYFADSEGLRRLRDGRVDTVAGLPPFRREPPGMAIARDGTVAVADPDRDRVWLLPGVLAGAAPELLPLHVPEARRLAFTTDGRLWATSGDRLIRVRVSDRARDAVIEVPGLADVAVDPAGSVFALRVDDRGARLARVTGGRAEPFGPPLAMPFARRIAARGVDEVLLLDRDLQAVTPRAARRLTGIPRPEATFPRSLVVVDGARLTPAYVGEGAFARRDDGAIVFGRDVGLFVHDGAGTRPLSAGPRARVFDVAVHGDRVVATDGRLLRELEREWLAPRTRIGAGFRDGALARSRFDGPAAVAFGPDGALYVADRDNDRVRVVRAGVVSTLAGGDGALLWPHDVAVGPDGAVYVLDHSRRVHVVRAGALSVFAGTGMPGSLDGPVERAAFARPRQVTVDSDGSVWVLDDERLRRVADGVVATIASD